MRYTHLFFFPICFLFADDSNNGDAAAAQKMGCFCGCGQVLSLREMFAGCVCGIFLPSKYISCQVCLPNRFLANGCFYLGDLPFKMFLLTEPVSWFYAFNKCV